MTTTEKSTHTVTINALTHSDSHVSLLPLDNNNAQTDAPSSEQQDNNEQLDMNMQQVIKLQHKDESFKDIITYSEQDVLPNESLRAQAVFIKSHLYTISDDALYRVYVRDGKGKRSQRTILQLVIPRSLVHIILANAHDSPVSGSHMGITRTIEKVRDKYYFPKRCSEISKYIELCIFCSQRKRPA